MRDIPPLTDLYVPPVTPPAVPVNTVQLVALPANAGQAVTRTVAWGTGWSNIANGDTLSVNIYQGGGLIDTVNSVVANYPGGNVPGGAGVFNPAGQVGPGTYKWGVIVTNVAGPSIEYQTTDSVAT